jgi:hypothetical protein
MTTSRHDPTPVSRPLPTLRTVQPRREGFSPGYGECPCCYGERVLYAYDLDQPATPQQHPCGHCQGSGQVPIDNHISADATPMRSASAMVYAVRTVLKIQKSRSKTKSAKPAKRQGRKR